MCCYIISSSFAIVILRQVLAAAFTDSRVQLDAIYLHDKKNATNCPQVYSGTCDCIGCANDRNLTSLLFCS